MKTLQNIYPAILTVIAVTLTVIVFITAIHGLVNDPSSLVYLLLHK